MTSFRPFAAAAAGLALLATGCQRGPELGTVAGTIKVNGEPLPFAYVRFDPVDPPRVYGAAYADANGHYELKFTQARDGAPVGKHRVTITAARGDELPDDAPAEARVRLPSNDNESSDLVREVKPGHNEIDFELVIKATNEKKPRDRRQSLRSSGRISLH
jgi:hypothetical protein